MNYPVAEQARYGAGPLNGKNTLDQIEEVIIKQLKDSPDSRRAIATTLVPEIDAFSKEPPCITQLQALQSRGKLHFWRLSAVMIFLRPLFPMLLA